MRRAFLSAIALASMQCGRPVKAYAHLACCSCPERFGAEFIFLGSCPENVRGSYNTKSSRRRDVVASTRDARATRMKNGGKAVLIWHRRPTERPIPPMSSPSPDSNAADNILRRCAPLETRDSGPSLPSLHKSRNDAMPPLPRRGFAFQNDDDGPLLHGGGGHRGRWRVRKRSNNSASRKSKRREIATNRRRF